MVQMEPVPSPPRPQRVDLSREPAFADLACAGVAFVGLARLPSFSEAVGWRAHCHCRRTAVC